MFGIVIIVAFWIKFGWFWGLLGLIGALVEYGMRIAKEED